MPDSCKCFQEKNNSPTNISLVYSTLNIYFASQTMKVNSNAQLQNDDSDQNKTNQLHLYPIRYLLPLVLVYTIMFFIKYTSCVQFVIYYLLVFRHNNTYSLI